MKKNFLAKKSWHTGTIRNMEKVWLAEQRHDQEKKKIEELQREKQKEREVTELKREIELKGANGNSKRERLDWMYSQVSSFPTVGGDSLLNTSDPSAALGGPDSDLKGSALFQAASKTAADGVSYSLEQPYNTQELWNKINEDPLLLIRKEEQALQERTQKLYQTNILAERLLHEERERKEKKEKKRQKKEEKKNRSKSKVKSHSDSTSPKRRSSSKERKQTNHISRADDDDQMPSQSRSNHQRERRNRSPRRSFHSNGQSRSRSPRRSSHSKNHRQDHSKSRSPKRSNPPVDEKHERSRFSRSDDHKWDHQSRSRSPRRHSRSDDQKQDRTLSTKHWTASRSRSPKTKPSSFDRTLKRRSPSPSHDHFRSSGKRTLPLSERSEPKETQMLFKRRRIASTVGLSAEEMEARRLEMMESAKKLSEKRLEFSHPTDRPDDEKRSTDIVPQFLGDVSSSLYLDQDLSSQLHRKKFYLQSMNKDE